MNNGLPYCEPSSVDSESKAARNAVTEAGLVASALHSIMDLDRAGPNDSLPRKVPDVGQPFSSSNALTPLRARARSQDAPRPDTPPCAVQRLLACAHAEQPVCVCVCARARGLVQRGTGAGSGAGAGKERLDMLTPTFPCGLPARARAG